MNYKVPMGLRAFKLIQCHEKTDETLKENGNSLQQLISCSKCCGFGVAIVSILYCKMFNTTWCRHDFTYETCTGSQ